MANHENPQEGSRVSSSPRSNAANRSVVIALSESANDICERITTFRIPDIAEELNHIPSLPKVSKVLSLFPVPLATEVCDDPHLRRRGAILEQMEPEAAAKILDGLSADQRTDIFGQMSLHGGRRILALLTAEARGEVEKLLQYPEHTAGDLMTTEFVQLNPTQTVQQALEHIRNVARERETIYASYVLEPEGKKLVGVLSLRDLIVADPSRLVGDVMRRDPISVHVLADEVEVAQKVSKYNLLALPVIDDDQHLLGFVTVDDVIDAIVHEGTNDMLRLGGVEPAAIDIPYVATPFWKLVKMRATWLVILFLGEMLTATAMGYYEDAIAKAVVLALFVPLIISSGGNSGSQATTLIIRALALREIKLGEWWRVMGRELSAGLALGSILGIVGFARILLWQCLGLQDYGEHWFLIASTVGLALIFIVLWGTLCGAMLPFILKCLGLDPATSSAPFVATLVDVTGLMIYFTVASTILRGTLL